MNVFIYAGLVFLVIGGIYEATISHSYSSAVAALLLGIANYLLFTK